MAKLVLPVTLLALILVAHGANLNLQKFLNPDAFSESKNPPKGIENVVERFVTQRVDNFDPTNYNTWQQRYLVNGEFWAPGGCIFILLAGAWEITPDRFVDTMMYEMSNRYNCYMFHLEHRYYGESRPTEYVFFIIGNLSDTKLIYFQRYFECKLAILEC